MTPKILNRNLRQSPTDRPTKFVERKPFLTTNHLTARHWQLKQNTIQLRNFFDYKFWRLKQLFIISVFRLFRNKHESISRHTYKKQQKIHFFQLFCQTITTSKHCTGRTFIYIPNKSYLNDITKLLIRNWLVFSKKKRLFRVPLRKFKTTQPATFTIENY